MVFMNEDDITDKNKGVDITVKKNGLVGVIVAGVVLLAVIAGIVLLFIGTGDKNHSSMGDGTGGSSDTSDSDGDEGGDTEDNYSSFIKFSNDDFSRYLDDGGDDRLVFVGRPTCSYCASLAPKLKKVSGERDVKVYFYDTNVARSDNSELFGEILDRIGVTGVPVTISFKDGIEIERFVGDMTETELNDFFDKL